MNGAAAQQRATRDVVDGRCPDCPNASTAAAARNQDWEEGEGKEGKGGDTKKRRDEGKEKKQKGKKGKREKKVHGRGDGWDEVPHRLEQRAKGQTRRSPARPLTTAARLGV